MYSPNAIKIDTRLPIDYWEVDPAWDGKIFKSAAQAQRPMRSGEIAKEIQIKTGRKVCIRLVTIDGEMFQLNLKSKFYSSAAPRVRHRHPRPYRAAKLLHRSMPFDG